MKKFTKMIAVLAVLTMIFALPVMAREVSFSSENTDVLIQMLNQNTAKVQSELADWKKVQCGPGADAIIAAQTAMVNSKLAAVNKECAENHINLLKGKVYNAKQLEATRLAQLNNFKTLYAGSASWIGELQKAQKEYDDCVAARVAAEAYLAAAQTKLAPFLK